MWASKPGSQSTCILTILDGTTGTIITLSPAWQQAPRQQEEGIHTAFASRTGNVLLSPRRCAEKTGARRSDGRSQGNKKERGMVGRPLRNRDPSSRTQTFLLSKCLAQGCACLIFASLSDNNGTYRSGVHSYVFLFFVDQEQTVRRKSDGSNRALA